MKRADLIRHIESYGCLFVREGGNHTVYRSPVTGTFTTIPRHRVIKKQLARKICDDLGIPRPQQRQLDGQKGKTGCWNLDDSTTVRIADTDRQLTTDN